MNLFIAFLDMGDWLNRLNLPSSLSEWRGQVTDFAREVLAEGAEEVAGISWEENFDLELVLYTVHSLALAHSRLIYLRMFRTSC